MDSRSEIVEFSLGMFLKYGVKSVTMDDLSNAMGISKKTLYQFVDNKEDLINAVVEKIGCEDKMRLDVLITKSKNAIDGVMLVAQEAAVKLELVSPIAVYDLKKYYQSIWQVIEQKEIDFIFTFVSNNLRRGQIEGLYRTDIDEDFMKRLYAGLAFTTIDERIFPRNKFSKKQLLRDLMEHYLLGIVTEAGKQVLNDYKN